MLSKYEARLDAVYRSVDACLEVLNDLEYLEDHAAGARVGFGPDMKRRVFDSLNAAVDLVNRLSAVYRDANDIWEQEVPRLMIDPARGAPELTEGWGEVTLRGEVLWFLATEAAAAEKALEKSDGDSSPQ